MPVKGREPLIEPLGGVATAAGAVVRPISKMCFRANWIARDDIFILLCEKYASAWLKSHNCRIVHYEWEIN